MKYVTHRKRLRFKQHQSNFPNTLFACGLAAILPVILLFPIISTHQWAASAATLSAPQSAKWAAQMPEGDAKIIIVTKCQLCHSLARIVISHRPKDEWEYLVGLMIERGAPITPGELPLVVDYLAKNFGRTEAYPSAGTSATTAASEGDQIVDPDQALFSAVPDSLGLPNAVQMSIVSGDPSKTGSFSIMVKIPAGLVIPPHWFSSDENIACLRGTFQFGEGDTVDAGKLRPLSPGAVWHVHAQMHHFAQVKESTIILIYGEGPLLVNSK